jgi:two-component system LytT family sensor kinase
MHSPFTIRRFQLVFGAAWMIWMAGHVGILYWYGFSFRGALIDSVITNILLLLACVAVSNNLRYFQPSQKKYSYLFWLCFFMTLIWFFVSRFLIILFLEDSFEYVHFFSQSVPVRVLFGLLLIGIAGLSSLLWYNLQNQQEAERRKKEAENLAIEAELFNLRQQLQPHFLFNSLNSINALIGFEPDMARKMIQQLSDFLRGTLRKEARQWSTLAEELTHLQLYLEIEKVRFGHRLSTRVESDEETENMKLPAMLLQPVVENAIKYGLYDTMGDIEITIIARAQHPKELVITVTNPYDPTTTGKGTGFGLSSIQRRLYLLFAGQQLLKTGGENGIFTTVLTIPQIAS